MKGTDAPPHEEEIRLQLRKMLSSQRFKNAPNPAAFLELGVNRALAGKKTAGKTIAVALFGEKFVQGESVEVRVTASNLRKTLKKYYEREGRDDMILISYPAPLEDKSIRPTRGHAYTPRFTYNPNHADYMVLRIAYGCMERSMHREYVRAMRFFQDVVDRAPCSVGAVLGLVEVVCHLTDCSWQQLDSYPDCDALLNSLQNRAEKYWRYWAVKAYLASSQGNHAVVASLYEKAVALDSESTGSFLPYLYFLADSNKQDEAVVLGQRHMLDRVEDPNMVAHFATVLMYAGRRDAGIAHLKAVLEIDPANVLAHQWMASATFHAKDLEALAEHIRALRIFCDPITFAWIINLLKGTEAEHNLTGFVSGILEKPASALAAEAAKQ